MAVVARSEESWEKEGENEEGGRRRYRNDFAAYAIAGKEPDAEGAGGH